MSYRRHYSIKMCDYDDDVTVVDVYDLASDIGKECEIIIDRYGSDAVTALLPKVINALELLENLAVRNEKENQALRELTAKISQLENDKIEKAEYRQRFEKEIEAIEEQWRSESAELVSAVGRLQDENKRLRRTLNPPADDYNSAPASPAREQDQEVLSRLSSTAEKQRSTLRHQESQLQEKQLVIDGLTSQVEKLATVTRDLRRKHKQLQNQLRLVCEERSELTAIVQAQQKDIGILQQSEANKKCTSCGAISPDGAGTDDEDQSSKPTFSVKELRAILHERNELKLKLARFEQEMSEIRANPIPDSSSTDTTDTTSSLSAAAEPSVEECEEAPVQGPLPCEPDDAPWKKEHSGIRKFHGKSETACESFAMTKIIFANSLRTRTSPWARSQNVHSQQSQQRWRPPVAPPSTRRHSEPHTSTSTYTHTHPHTDTSLRQELTSIDLEDHEVTEWLGDDIDYKGFNRIRKSISLEHGIEILTHSKDILIEHGSVASICTNIQDHERLMELYRSFDDISTSPFARSRRALLLDDCSNGGNILRWSYDEIYEQEIYRSLHDPLVTNSIGRISKSDIDIISIHSIDSLDCSNSDPCARSMSLERITLEKDRTRFINTRLLKVRNIYKIQNVERNWRKDVVKTKIDVGNTVKDLHLGSSQSVASEKGFVKDLRRVISSAKLNILVPKVTTDFESDICNAKSETSLSDSTSSLKICNCRICSENVDARGRKLSRLQQILSASKAYGRKIRYWDENNNMKTNEMYVCIVQVLKLLFGLWLRHLDHK